MQYVNCDVFLSGNRNHCVPKARVSVAEVVVLKALHGADAVTNIRHAGERRANAKEEVARLCQVYASRAEEIRQSIFPGANPSVPVSLRDIGVEAETPKTRSGKSKKAGKASADKNQADDDDGNNDDASPADDSDPLA